MDFQWTENQKNLKRAVRDFMKKEIIPFADEYDRFEPLPYDRTMALIKKLLPLGYITGLAPREYGGLDLGFVSSGLLIEELSGAYGSLAGMIVEHGAWISSLCRIGTSEQKEKYLMPMLSGDILSGISITEPGAGSDNRAMTTSAILDDDNYVIHGTKIWSSNGCVADIDFVAALTDPATRSISWFIVEKDVSPFNARNLPKIGLRSWSHAEITFDHCRVPKGNLFGPVGEGYRMTMELFLNMRAFIGLMAVGIAQVAIDRAVGYAKERVQFGKPIGGFQMIQEMIADMVMETEAARFLCYRALQLLDHKIPCNGEACMAKAYATERAIEVTGKAIQIHGAYGLSRELALERYFRDARCLTMPMGTTQIMKLIVGRETLGISAFV
jgi:alkylation response protein AidB-like acyl-CoA dehydrogenase